MTAPRIAVVLLLWNPGPFLGPCLFSLRRQTLPDVELVLVDNGSTDGSLAVLERDHPELRLIKNDRNLGFAGGMNVGIRASSAPIVALLNQDTELDPTVLERVAAAFDSDPAIGVVGAKLRYPDRLRLQHAGAYLEYPLALGQHVGYGQLDVGQFDEPRDVEWVNGALIGLRRAALDAVGLLDERFWPGYFEEVDLCKRMREAQWRVTYRPEVSLVHHEYGSFGRTSDRYYTAYHRSRLRYVLKHFTVSELREFAMAEAARFPTLGSAQEQRILVSVYREIASEVTTDRPEALPFFQRLFALEPPTRSGRLAAYRRHFHPARLSGIGAIIDRLHQQWRVVGPPIIPPERDAKGLLLGTIRTISWLIIRWSFLPVLEAQDRYNALVLNALESTRDELGGVLGLLGELVGAVDRALDDVEARAMRTDGLESDARDARRLIGELALRVSEIEALAIGVDRDATQVRAELARLRTRLRVASGLNPGGGSELGGSENGLSAPAAGSEPNARRDRATP